LLVVLLVLMVLLVLLVLQVLLVLLCLRDGTQENFVQLALRQKKLKKRPRILDLLLLQRG
jgi:hypothetical protein